MTQRQLVELKRSERPAARILCFPYAGGHAAFTRSWARELPEAVELLGIAYRRGQTRQSRGQPSAQDLALSVLEEVLQYGDRPLILFGYSLGAVIAYEVSQLLLRTGRSQPAELIVAARRAPHLPSNQKPMAQLPDDQFTARLREIGGTPQEVLDNAELLGFFMPILRTDFAIAENYQPAMTTPLQCPITGIAGSADASADAAAVRAWQNVTTGGFSFHQLEGHHFFLHQQPQAVLDIVRAAALRHQ